jgi:ribosomal protein S18 acetylase RimI-like enzyme
VIPATTLFEAHLAVADVERSAAFYREVVGLLPALDLPERGAAFLWIGAPGRAMLGLWSLGSAPMAVQSHVAFGVALADVLAAPDALRGAGLQPLSFFAEPADEPSVIAWMPAAAVYFRDPDGHLLEYLAMLDGPGDPQGGIVPWSASAYAAGAGAVTVREHAGPRAELRGLFALAEDSAAQLDAYLDDGRALVAERDGAIVGHLQLVDGPRRGQAEIKNMAVLPERQRQGVGRALVRAAVTAASDAGRREVVVATAAADVGNLRFYQRLGFRLTGIEPDAFTPATGYAEDITIDGIPLRDRVWLSLVALPNP